MDIDGISDTVSCRVFQSLMKKAIEARIIQEPAQNSSRAVPAKVRSEAGKISQAITMPVKPAP